MKLGRGRGLVGLLLLASALVGGPSWAQGTCDLVVVSGDADYQPLSWYDGKEMHGAAEAIVGAALDRLHLRHEDRYVGPFKRVLAAAETGEVDIVAELKRAPDREAFLAFPPTPIFVNPVAVFTHRTRHLALPKREDLVGLRGGIVLANQFGGGLDAFLGHLSIEEVPRLDLGLKMLEQDRIDYFLTGYYPGMNYLLDQGWATTYTIQRPFIVATENFVGISRQSRCFTQLTGLDQILAKMRRDGEMVRLFNAATAVWRSRADQGE